MRAREFEVDWPGLHAAFQMNVPQVRCYWRLSDGAILKLTAGDPCLDAVRAAPNEHLAIENVPSGIQYQWVSAFIETIEDTSMAERLHQAVNGKGAFRRFKDILHTADDVRQRWFEFRDEMVREHIIEWVREHGIVPSNAPDWERSIGVPSQGSTQVEKEVLRDFLIEKASGALPNEPPKHWEHLAGAICDAFWVTKR